MPERRSWLWPGSAASALGVRILGAPTKEVALHEGVLIARRILSTTQRDRLRPSAPAVHDDRAEDSSSLTIE